MSRNYSVLEIGSWYIHRLPGPRVDTALLHSHLSDNATYASHTVTFPSKYLTA